MTLRKQSSGGQKSWARDEVKAGLEHFFKERGRYPSALEIDAYPYLPSSRSIERRFGGLVSLRKELAIPGQTDLRSGAHSSSRARTINTRAHALEKDVYETLCGRFGKEFVHPEYFFMDDRRSRADFFVYDACNGFCVDIFYPATRHSLVGCLNSKLRKYISEMMRQYPVIFLQMNHSLPQKTLDELIAQKKKKLPPGQTLMGWPTFVEFIKTRKPR